MVRVLKKMNSLDKGFIQARGIQRMSRVIVIGIALLGMILSMAGCSSSGEPIKATWVTVPVAFDTVSIPVSAVNNNKMIHFLLGTGPTGDIAFMAYELDGKIYVRSNVCPPCWSMGFSLQKDILVCDRCATTFKAKTGDGIKGVQACVGYPKASVPYEIRDGTMIMKRIDLITAYQFSPILPGLPWQTLPL